MHLVYIDDSYEDPVQVYGAIAIDAIHWHQAYLEIQEWRRALKASDGILIRKEFHATEFVSGRGRLGDQIVTKYRRSQIFREAFVRLSQIEGVHVFGSCRTTKLEWTFERLITRIQKTMVTWQSHAILFCDEGREQYFTKLVRKMRVHNPLYLSDFHGNRSILNLQATRVLEDPVFKSSQSSFFIQMADFVAYALLRREKPLASKNKYGIHQCYELLGGSLVRLASRTDPLGIIR